MIPNLLKEYEELKNKANSLKEKLWIKNIALPKTLKELWIKELEGREYDRVKFSGNESLIYYKDDVFNIIPVETILLAAISYDFSSSITKVHNFLLTYDNKSKIEGFIKDAKKNKELPVELEDWLKKNLDDNEFNLVSQIVTDYSLWGGGKTLDRNDAHVSPVYKAIAVTQSFSCVHEVLRLLDNYENLYTRTKIYLESLNLEQKNEVKIEDSEKKDSSILGENVIYYGAPGTGKSYDIVNYINEQDENSTYDEDTLQEAENVYRVTLHPEYEYSDFVGQLLPQEDGTFDYNIGVFSSAYAYAKDHPNIPVFMILEEMSRANVAAVFGDLFQLLDRKENGSSEYAIDNPMVAKIIAKSRGLNAYKNKLVLPSNLYIIGTVNTSDQNVFVMDTAFKRRFRWVYKSTDVEDINKFDNNPNINLFDEVVVDWYSFYTELNEFITDALEMSEDKQVGPYFVKFGNVEKQDPEKAHNMLQDKLLQYLWEDVELVARNGFAVDKSRTIFRDDIKSFPKLYKEFKGNRNVFSNLLTDKFEQISDSNKEKSGEPQINENID